MAEDRKKHYFLKLWELVDEVILAGALYPLVKGLAMKGVEKLGKRVEEKLGFGSLDDAKKKVEDNILYGSVCLDGLGETELTTLKDFEKKLKQEENGSDKVQALVFYIIKGMLFFKVDVTKTSGGDKKGPKEIVKEADYSKGAKWAVKFLRQLLSYRTFEERVEFLEHEEVFSLIQKKKETIDLIDKAREFYVFGRGKFSDLFDKVSERAVEERSSFSADCKSFKEKAKTFYESSKGGRK